MDLESHECFQRGYRLYCKCNIRMAKRRSQTQGNFNRWFYNCSKSIENQCGAFVWAETFQNPHEVDNLMASGVLRVVNPTSASAAAPPIGTRSPASSACYSFHQSDGGVQSPPLSSGSSNSFAATPLLFLTSEASSISTPSSTPERRAHTPSSITIATSAKRKEFLTDTPAKRVEFTTAEDEENFLSQLPLSLATKKEMTENLVAIQQRGVSSAPLQALHRFFVCVPSLLIRDDRNPYRVRLYCDALKAVLSLSSNSQ